jgi:hypothetical protein
MVGEPFAFFKPLQSSTHQEPAVSVVFTSGRLAGNKLEPYERELRIYNVCRRNSAFFLVTSRRIFRSTSVERNLKK